MSDRHDRHTRPPRTSRLAGFYRKTVPARLRLLEEHGFLTPEDRDVLAGGRAALDAEAADRLIENVVGVLGLPLGIGLNLVVNGRDYLVPMAVEEPSIVAAVSSAAKTVRAAGGFTCVGSDPLLIGQVQVVGVPHALAMRETVLARRAEILDLANSLHPHMVARGGGARDVDVHVHPATSTSPEMFIVHVLVDTRDAMGANLVNSMCEGVAPLVERMTGGKVFLRILSNLADRAMVTATATIPVDLLASDGYSGEEVRDGIILANQFAEVDPYRAATHNKGILNGIDAVAVATGNDWRAIEASAHAYAGLHGRYRALTRWWRTEQGHLGGALELPLKVGTVGGQVQSNPTAQLALRILDVRSARELAEVMAAVGLAQNFAAIRALSTDGIQRGHMALHARSVAVAAGTPAACFEDVVARLIAEGDVKVRRAREILAELGPDVLGDVGGGAGDLVGVGHGKLILLGEHSVVYGRHALAAPVGFAMRAVVEEAEEGFQLIIPQWNVSETMELGAPPRNSLEKSLLLILERLGIGRRPLSIRVQAGVPRAMGMGGSAALAVAVTRAAASRFVPGLGDEEVNAIAYEAEQIAHGRASGIDNSVATYGRPLLFRRAPDPVISPVRIGARVPLVVGLSRREGLTAAMVARVAAGVEKAPQTYQRLFDEMDGLALQGRDALETGDLETLGHAMNLCQGFLNALQVSTHELEEMVEICRTHGALGAKLTGAGGGGAMIALAPGDRERIAEALRAAGYRAFLTELQPTEPTRA
jgi:hydroxymethylglutaryl-CoA reductase